MPLPAAFINKRHTTQAFSFSSALRFAPNRAPQTMKQLLLQRLFSRKTQTFPPAARQQPSLALCILMDLVGYASFALPLLGEVTDIVWAPISAAIFMRMFGGAKGFFGGIFNFVEELLPGLDFIPTFTIMWAITYFRKAKQARTIILKAR